MPAEVITFVVTMVIRLIAAKFQNDKEIERDKYALEKEQYAEMVEAQKSIRAQVGNALFGWTFSVTAFVCLFAIVVIPLISPIIFAMVEADAAQVSYVYEETSRGFLFLTKSIEKTKSLVAEGITVLPFHTHIAAAIAGALFGNNRRGK